MQSLLIIVACVFAVSIVIIAIIRKRLKAKADELSEAVNELSFNGNKSDCGHTEESLSALSDGAFVDIPTELDSVFNGKIISSAQENELFDRYMPFYQEVCSLLRKFEIFHISPSETISKFAYDFGTLHRLIKQHNEKELALLLDTHKDFFDHCLQYPLDKQQRRSIVSEENNCLVVSSAGSGKTSSIVGKVKYLTEIKNVSPHRILLISYTNKAAAELTERMATDGLKGYTFHKLAIDIIGRATGTKPSVCDNTDALFIEIYHALSETEDFKKNILEYFVDHQVNETDLEQYERERREKLSEEKKVRLKAMFPDMDGRAIYVRSEQEQKICFALSSLGVKFRYEEPYEHQLADEIHSQYRPDFSIYFEKGGSTKRIYLEHFGIDEHNLVPTWFAQDKNMTYEEACREYNDGITWKKAAHEKFGTQLLTTSSADFHYSDIKGKLRKLLKGAGVPIQEKTDAELYELILPKGSKLEKALIRLVATFVTLVKSSCKSVDEVLQQAEKASDERSVFIIEKIFRPVYERYKKALAERAQIDFTDVILQATEICRTSHPVAYDYIIVDEFQDISVDRYNFLKVLREGNPPAKLYCVGDDWQSIYRFSGSDMALFNQFEEYFGPTDINKIETTYRFGEPLVGQSSRFIQRNKAQIQKNIRSFNAEMKTELEFCPYDKRDYCKTIEQLVASVPSGKSVFLLGRYSFDDYYLSFTHKMVREGNRAYYMIGGRKIEILTVHKSKGLEADYVILLQCNKDTYGFPSLVSDDPVLSYVLTEGDQFPFGEERRLFYVAITRAKTKTIVLYDRRFPSVFVDEFLHPEKITEESYAKHRNANKRWTGKSDQFLLKLHREGRSVKYISNKMGRSQTSVIMRLGKLIQ
ncbi:UvrD-helicase domain-containing protein [Prevotella sp. HUN102]|uniref:UvrD-helicase domain-containing protein n=1 Tax=Prevotella sp. HUN102 TaxID=1392486 RepID=UPI0004919B88|nr:UvrD-helicase domain-containing protein [Prevotella sp. HUN102]